MRSIIPIMSVHHSVAVSGLHLPSFHSSTSYYGMEKRHSKRCSSSRRVTAGLLLSFLAFIPSSSAIQVPLQPSIQPSISPSEHTFSLRHIFHHGTYRDPNLHKRLDIRPHHEFVTSYEDELPQDVPPPLLTAKSSGLQIERLADRRFDRVNDHLDYASLTGGPRVLGSEHWTLDDVPGPNVTDKQTVINLAIMAANAYVPKAGQEDWEDLTQGYNLSTSFGWEGDGLRGHIFADEGNKTIVVGLKGTSPAVFDGDGTTTGDKINDNLFFSCCCGQGGQFFWRQACNCQTSTYTCNSTCLVKSLKEKTRYYSAALDLYANVTELYPNSTIWLVGHSLGGAVSALLGLTFGLPVVTYEAPGDDLAARRLGLPVPSHANPYHPFQQKYTGAVHFGHTADPIFMGACNGATAPCTLGGYAMETRCHTGVQCVYDTVGDHGWRIGLGYHRIHDVIDNVIRKYDHPPECIPDTECYDCFNWKFFESNGSDPKTSTTIPTTKTTQTRTATCKTPGWWGCLDDPKASSTPVITTTYTTTSCARPGWFGCNKEVNVTVTTTTASPTTTKSTLSASATTTCEHPGWFGCEDDDITTSRTKSASHTATRTGSTSTCETPGIFFGCYDKTTTRGSSTTSTSTSTRTTHKTRATETCETPGLFFGCYDRTRHESATSPSITPPPTTSSVISSPTATSTRSKGHKHEKECKHPAFFGLICLGRD